MEKKTTLNVAYDLELIETGNKSITVMAICEDGSQEFTFNYPHAFDRHMTEAIENDDFDYLIDDFSEIEKFVDATTLQFIAGEIAKLCVGKSNDLEHWSFSISTLGSIKVTIIQAAVFGGGMMQVLEKYYAEGQDAINDLIYNLNV